MLKKINMCLAVINRYNILVESGTNNDNLTLLDCLKFDEFSPVEHNILYAGLINNCGFDVLRLIVKKYHNILFDILVNIFGFEYNMILLE